MAPEVFKKCKLKEEEYWWILRKEQTLESSENLHKENYRNESYTNENYTSENISANYLEGNW